MKKIFILLLAVVMSAFILTAAFSCTVFAASEEPLWFSDSGFAVYGDTVYIPSGYESFVSGMKQHEGYPDAIKDKAKAFPSSSGKYLDRYCFYGNKIYYSIGIEGGAGVYKTIYSCDLDGSNDEIVADYIFKAVICDNYIYYSGYDLENDRNNIAIYKADLSNLSSKTKLAIGNNIDDENFVESLSENYVDFSYFDGDWIYYSTGADYYQNLNYYKMDINGNNVASVSGTLDEFVNRFYGKLYIYGDKTYYFDGSTLYERDRNGGNAVSLTSVSSADMNSTYILGVTDDYVYYSVNKYVYAAEKLDNSSISVILDGETLSFDQEPAIIDGRTMVPLRSIFEAMGYTVDWNQDTQTASAVKGSDSITVQLNNNVISYTLNGEANTYTCDTAPQAVNDRTLVPVRAIAECAGCDVNWNNDTKTVTITSN